ncbi:hypothetical protein [Bacteriovorax sp. Seq25_V]|uniref:hypothetical protein n=1 Tax=Bacteriovorax sp. Seq25_V TaxID=1201288 RepID=UPI000389DCC1|nr:hypothetical protein [Bacteriovorax sp. Seq25_V]EQC46925.1 hypothetical protein M900_2523 [Bacteriovorax sp. Seq25_V]
MKVGIDLDNTLINYSDIWKELAPLHEEPKEYLKSHISNEEWIKIQGQVYGEKIHKAHINEEWFNLINLFKECNVNVEFVSHKTELSLCGNYRLRDEASFFLKRHGLDSIKTTYHNDILNKINYINDSNFDFMIDDLIPVLSALKGVIPLYLGNTLTELPSFSDTKGLCEFFSHFEFNTFTKTSRTSFRVGNKYYKYHLSQYRQINETKYLKFKNIKFISKNGFIIQEEIKNLSPLTSIDSAIGSKICSALMAARDIPNVSYARDTWLHPASLELLSRRLENNTSKFNNLLNESFTNSEIKFNDLKAGFFLNPDLHPGNIKKDHNQIIIFDYESAGVDDPVRALLNFLYHPQNDLDFNSNCILIKEFKLAFPEYFIRKNIESYFAYTSILWLDILSRNNVDISNLLNECRSNPIFSWKYEYYEYF